MFVVAVDFALSSDQQQVADAFGAFFKNESTIEVVRNAEPLGFSQRFWVKSIELEAPGMACAAASGGSGASLSDLIVVAEALGATLAPVPLLEHWVASQLLPDGDVVTGTAIATVALRPADADGMWMLVPAGAVADVVIGIDGNEVVAVRSTPPGEAPPNHASAPLANRSARDGDRQVLGPASNMDLALNLWRTLNAAALVGLAHRATDIGLEYAKERQAFGQPIGSFQAVQHGFAGMPALIDGARFLTHKAAWAHDKGLVDGAGVIDMDQGNITEFAPLAHMAFVQAAEAAAVCTDKSLHYHGGYGFSQEYDIQLYFRRARGWANIMGDPAGQRLRLADLLWPAGGAQ